MLFGSRFGYRESLIVLQLALWPYALVGRLPQQPGQQRIQNNTYVVVCSNMRCPEVCSEDGSPTPDTFSIQGGGPCVPAAIREVVVRTMEPFVLMNSPRDCRDSASLGKGDGYVFSRFGVWNPPELA